MTVQNLNCTFGPMGTRCVVLNSERATVLKRRPYRTLDYCFEAVKCSSSCLCLYYFNRRHMRRDLLGLIKRPKVTLIWLCFFISVCLNLNLESFYSYL